MEQHTQNALRALFNAREEVSFYRLQENPAYQEVCRRQEKSEEEIKVLYQRFDQSEQIRLQEHDEGEVHKTSYELRAAYLQGLRDCYALIRFLNGTEVQL